MPNMLMQPPALVIAIAFLTLGFSTAVAEPSKLGASLERVKAEALESDLAFQITESLTTEVGARPVGTPEMDRARDWGIAKLEAMGFTNIKVDTFTTPTWRRIGRDEAEVVSPFPQKISLLALGGSVPTPPEGLEAEIVVLSSFQDLLETPEGGLDGKIVVVNEVMPRTQDLTGYRALIRSRTGASEAARRGAAAYLVRSLSPAHIRLPHTGGGGLLAGIPTAALATPDADLLARMSSRGPVIMKLKLDSVRNPNTVVYNISGEIPGTSPELIIVGGHLDSWDVGTGALDDAVGIGITMAAAKLAIDPNKPPRRTIRVVLWGSEEQGGSSRAYAETYAEEVPRMVVVGESDTGADRIFAASFPAGGRSHPAFRRLLPILASLEVAIRDEPANWGGVDIVGLVRAGAPVVQFQQDLTRYMDIHHSEDDTLDKIDPIQLKQNVAVWATFIHAAAYSDIDFRGE